MILREIWLVSLAIFVLACQVFVPTASEAADYTAGQSVILNSENPAGVPLHREARTSMFGRAPNSSVASIVATEQDGRWLSVTLADGRSGWIVDKYVASVVAGTGESDEPDDNSNDEWLVWQSREGCEQVLSAGRRMAPTSGDVLRIATWNIRWFPDGDMDAASETTEPTELAWLSCVVSWMNVDILALQEIRTMDAAAVAWESVVDGTDAFTGGEWKVGLQDCGGELDQHVGFLWNSTRVTLSDQQILWRLNAKATSEAKPCAGRNRPGRYAAVGTVGGGVDFHVISVHLKSGVGASDRDSRLLSLSRIDETVAPFIGSDGDVIILGDFNNMGIGDSESAAEEIETLAETAEAESPGFLSLPLEPQCTEYYRGEGGWLDHMLVARGMREVTASIRLTGYCAIANCSRLEPDDMPSAYRSLSDHCPIVLEIQNEDQD